MRNLDLVEFVSVDGVMQALAGPDGDFPYPGWGNEYPAPAPADPGTSPFAGTTGYLFGRRTYDEMVAFLAAPAGRQPDGCQPECHPEVRGEQHLHRSLLGADDGDLG